ncbi:inner membrane protein [Escherichia coli]|uniref:Inner membrane protein n=1 Tax=Escherichia coli TaxID=562 RepID=A0A376L4T0_ECOLX|nr:inner membrane protein [Escherichia coli]
MVLWAASLAALCYYVIYGQEFSQSVLFVMFETNTNEASEYLSQYFSLKIVLIAPGLYGNGSSAVDTSAPRSNIPKPWRYIVSFALLYGLILHPIAMNTFIKNKPFEKTLDNLALRVWSLPHPWQFLTGYYQYRQPTKLANKVTE